MQIRSSLIATMYGDAYSQSGLRSAVTSRQEEDAFVLENRKGSELFQSRDSQTALSRLQEEKSLISSQALKAPTGASEVGMNFSHINSSTTLSISEAALSLFQNEKKEALSAMPFANDDKENALSDVSLSMKGEKTDNEKTSEIGGSAKADEKGDFKEDENDPQVKIEINQLKQREKEVIAHEAAHKAVGGQYTGAVSYTYTMGPDNKKYISGGEVSIRTPSSSDPEEVLRIAEIVRRAALAPADPSSQDISVAADASQRAANARAEIAKLDREEMMQKQKEQVSNNDSEKMKKVDSADSISDEKSKAQKTDISAIRVSQGQKALKAYFTQSNLFKQIGENRFSVIG